MSSTKSSTGTDDLLGESWVEIGGGLCPQGGGTPASITQQLTADDYLRLLKEAQESNQSSCRDSLAGSRRDSPRSSPKSPPNSPVNQGPTLALEWQSYYVTSESREEFLPIDWSSRPSSIPPKSWSFRAPHRNDRFSLRYAKIGNTPLFSKKGICIMVLSNLFSLLVGAGVGVIISRCGVHLPVPAIKVR
ncbi:BCL2/adenovirus E1B 19 kDa protein-interacting protein 3 isoform X2 [Dendroctonus ponderosae]|uniref:BCL2/adenovirus E1B 19 kDa protein-interacting protein 3 n=1 Tax=Dendroctonus ponderosae TaxID=77166 RepID=U4UJQ1_DENPD|nr:BCL2/adenovirus E1B 19 kDa protein-interacting protein 3 isoform X2 [Dendroctonus ponderosae]ERL94319.1 hypothetical protein D910_11600 [Dendroctonus ponderosae]KAH1023528.1 hypothetical protein HUJ04_012716 [Dendroctonus ponderosae]KAH1023529.1 hypothetical protein HUJ04_012716 [Dendroctonus ponderosae]KAH1029979.1 hypothetical protein HUJ05_003122 [Dendroctonus ponderosae]